MKKPYIEELDEWATRNKKNRNLPLFLQVKADVEEALKNGFHAKTIWCYMKEVGRIEMSYELFTRYIRCHIAPIKQLKKRSARKSKETQKNLG